MLVPPDRLDEVEEIVERIKRGESISLFETERVTKDGRKFHVSLSLSPMRDASGRIVGVSTIARDITEHRRVPEEALKQSEERFRDPGRILAKCNSVDGCRRHDYAAEPPGRGDVRVLSPTSCSASRSRLLVPEAISQASSCLSR